MKLFLEQNTKNEQEYKGKNILTEFLVIRAKCINKTESVQVYKAFVNEKN